MSTRPSDHPGWTAASAGIETEDSRAFVASRAKDMTTELLESLSIEPTVDAWKRTIYASELLRRPAEMRAA